MTFLVCYRTVLVTNNLLCVSNVYWPLFCPCAAQGMPMFAQIPIFRQRAPGPHALLPMPLMQPTDIYLPCFSHHFITQGVREIVDHTQRLQVNICYKGSP